MEPETQALTVENICSTMQSVMLSGMSHGSKGRLFMLNGVSEVGPWRKSSGGEVKLLSSSERTLREFIPVSNETLPTSLLPWSSNDLSAVRLEINGVSVPDRPWFLRSMLVTLPEPSHVMSTKVSLHTSPLPNQDSGGLDNSLEMVHTSLKLATMKERDAMMTMMRRNALIAMANLGEFTENFLTFSLFSLSLNNGGGSSHSLSDGDRNSLSLPLSLSATEAEAW
jgi:hypothetical protein